MSKLLSFNEEGFQFAWDSTSIGSFQACPKKYYYSILQGWQSEFKSVHLIFGGLYASALETFHKLRAGGAGYDEAVRAVVRTAMINTWDTEANKPMDWMHTSKTRDTLIRSIVWYLDQYEHDTMETLILSDGRAAVEYSFTIELNEEYLYCGHIDRMVVYGGDNYVQDQKTTGTTITPRFFQGFSPDYQMTGYTLAGQIIFDIPVKGVVIDAAQIAVGFTRFERGFVTRHKAHLEEFREEVLSIIDHAKKCHTDKYYPMNRTSCGNYGGCEFQKICSALPVHRDALLQASFVKRERWDPLKKR